MRSYGQYCGLAKALDVIGDRWTLLIVRELLALGAARYSDLQHGLPGIATNLLASRLRDLEDHGLVVREEAPPPAPASLFLLTARGLALEPVIAALGVWGGPLLDDYSKRDAVRSHWLALPIRLYFADATPNKGSFTIEVRIGDEPMLIETVNGKIRARRGSAENPDAVLAGAPNLVLGVLSGKISVASARAKGMSFHGNQAVLKRLVVRKPSAVGSLDD